MVTRHRTHDTSYRSLRVSRKVLLLAMCLAGCGLASCQPDSPPTLTLRDAEQATDDLGKQAFVPPPKTIDDVIAHLDALRPVARLPDERTLQLAQQPRPPDLSGKELVNFYVKRAHAAARLGWMSRAADDYARAVPLVFGPKKGHLLTRAVGTSFAAGRYRDAITILRRAIAEGRPGQALKWTGNLAAILAKQGDLSGADAALESAEDLLDRLSFSPDWSRYRDNWTLRVVRARASVAEARGNYREAEGLRRAAIKHMEAGRRAGMARWMASQPDAFEDWLHAELANNLALQGRVVEAEAEAREALSRTLDRVGRRTGRVARMLGALASVLVRQGRFAEAERLTGIAIETLSARGVAEAGLGLLQTRRLHGDILTALGRWRQAAADFDAIERALAGDRNYFEQAFGGDVNRPLALIWTGRTRRAMAVARTALARKLATIGERHYETAEARGVLAMALAAAGHQRSALAAFNQALGPLLEGSRLSADENASRAEQDLRLRWIIEAYLRLLADIRSGAITTASVPDVAPDAFRVANAIGGQSVQAALDASAARAAARDPDLADLARRAQDARQQVNALYGALASAMAAPPEQRPDRAVMVRLRGQIDSLRTTHATLSAEIERRFPDYAALMNPKPTTMGRAQAALRPDEALIATYSGERQTYVWAVPHRGAPAFAVVPLGRKQLALLITRLRRALDPKATTLGGIPAFDVALAHRLYSDLLAPVEAGWRSAKSLVVVTPGPLGQLPLSVLVTAPARRGPDRGPLFASYRTIPFLARTHAISVVPSVSSLVTLRSIPPAAALRRNFVGFGDPAFSVAQGAAAEHPSPIGMTALSNGANVAVRGAALRRRAVPRLTGLSSAGLAKLPPLPETADEVRSMAAAMHADPRRDVFIGAAASEGRVKTMDLSRYKVIAFATHGLLPGDLNGLAQPALALSSPAVTGGRDDGLLTMGEILELKLNADWVVLSACNTAAGSGAGAEAVSGLGRAFFYAGTRALLVSNWPVETGSARALTTNIFEREARDPRLSREEALRRSMLSLIDRGGMRDSRGRMVFSYAHPIFWAPFSLVGDGRGAG